MSSLQRVTIERFIEAVGQKTYNEYSLLTGIERTRLFRLFQGAEMKLAEFEIFQSFLGERNKAPQSVEEFMEEVTLDNSFSHCSQELKEQLVRVQRMKEYLELSQAA